MTDFPTLSGEIRKPASGGPAKQIVLFLHGVGADGRDLIGLSQVFEDILPDAVFVSPNAPFEFDMAPMGYQWFAIGSFDPEARLRGVRKAAPILDAYIDKLLADYGLKAKDMVLIGFSQGTMMALYVGLRRKEQLAGIIGYSGILAAPELLKDELQSRPPVLLVHGDADTVLPVKHLPAAVAGLEAVDVPVEGHVRPGLGHGIDEEGLRLGRAFLSQVFGG